MELDKDGKSAKLAIAGDFTAPQVEELIVKLATLRSQMTPEVPKVAPGGGGRPLEQATLFAGDSEMTVARLVDGRVRFWMRNIGLGWCAYNVPAITACGVRDFLIDRLPKTAPSVDLFGEHIGGKPN